MKMSSQFWFAHQLDSEPTVTISEWFSEYYCGGDSYSLHVELRDADGEALATWTETGEAGEDLIEKQNAEIGLMPVVVDEAAEYGYTAENRHMARAFLRGETPNVTFDDGLAVVELLMSACTNSGIIAAPMGKPRLLSERARPRLAMNQLGMTTAVATAMTPVFILRATICSA